MQYTIQEFDNAVAYLLPAIKQAMDKGVHFNRPSLGDMVIKQFVLSGDYKDLRDFEKQSAYELVITAMQDLDQTGAFNFFKE